MSSILVFSWCLCAPTHGAFAHPRNQKSAAFLVSWCLCDTTRGGFSLFRGALKAPLYIVTIGSLPKALEKRF